MLNTHRLELLGTGPNLTNYAPRNRPSGVVILFNQQGDHYTCLCKFSKLNQLAEGMCVPVYQFTGTTLTGKSEHSTRTDRRMRKKLVNIRRLQTRNHLAQGMGGTFINLRAQIQWGKSKHSIRAFTSTTTCISKSNYYPHHTSSTSLSSQHEIPECTRSLIQYVKGISLMIRSSKTIFNSKIQSQQNKFHIYTIAVDQCCQQDLFSKTKTKTKIIPSRPRPRLLPQDQDCFSGPRGASRPRRPRDCSTAPWNIYRPLPNAPLSMIIAK